MMDTLPVELIKNILSFLPLIDRVKCESINRKFNYICKDLWSQQTSIDENELPATKWITEFQTILPNVSDVLRSDLVRWQLTLKCPRIKKMVIDETTMNSEFFKERISNIQHLTVKEFSDNFHILNEAKNLQTIVFDKSDCNEYEIIQHLTANVTSIEGPSICDPWVNKWDEFFEHSDCDRFRNLKKLTVVISLQTINQLNNLTKLDQLTYIRFLIGDDFDNHFLIEYLQSRGSKLDGLELFLPNYHTSCRNVYAAVSNNCIRLKQLGMKGNFHAKGDYVHFKNFLFNFKYLMRVSLNIPLALTQAEVDTICHNNQNLRELNYTYYMPSISAIKLKNCKQHCEEMKLRVDNYNKRNSGRSKVIFDTSHVINKILSNKL